MSAYTDPQATVEDIIHMDPEELPWAVAVQLALIRETLKDIAETLAAMRAEK